MARSVSPYFGVSILAITILNLCLSKTRGTFSSPEAALLLVSTKLRKSRPPNPIFRACAEFSFRILHQSHFCPQLLVSTVNLSVASGYKKARSGKSRDYRDLNVFEKLRFENVFRNLVPRVYSAFKMAPPPS